MSPVGSNLQDIGLAAFDDIVDHCCYAWNTLIDHPSKVMSIA
jgi:hypothetical protein